MNGLSTSQAGIDSSMNMGGMSSGIEGDPTSMSVESFEDIYEAKIDESINKKVKDLLEKKVLKEAGVDYVELGGVQANPRLNLVYEGVELCRKENVDLMI